MAVAEHRGGGGQYGESGRDRDEFARLSEPFRHELLVYCYRMLGSVHDAEDLVQEVYLRAWRSYAQFEARASLRTWLYRIATNTCLNALQHSSRRVLPSGLGHASDAPEVPSTFSAEVPWLEPLPDRMIGTLPDDPAAVVAFRAGIRLALIAALQHLPGRQRAVLLLRETLSMSTAQIAEQLGMTAAAVNSSLQRARARLDALAPASEEIAEPDDPGRRALLDRYAKAFESADVDALTRLFTEDAVVEMPPAPQWFTGHAMVARFFAYRFTKRPGRIRLVPTSANRQPAFASYRRLDDGTFEAQHVQVLTLSESGISHATAFTENKRLIRLFGMPLTATAEELDRLQP
ncbi:MAG TPA: sigma-70 family RNA polymerase sigma factor [Actinocrinis sp.]|uniref:sigma-70 family RNA polymerase sigma factor n=1 Tax=Actinocrinis sp. TaxID=1920516 RepID=UPI002DDD9CDE|nr:sigma-70 family RNA polymerase sigma factor [Actinocrinis sp.]HEV2344378.1 sigma-70 family RNA polymerase sigma factor [Actinocrinis sp.]